MKVHGPPKLIAAGKEFPFIVVSPQCPSRSRGWQPHELSALLDEIVEKYKVDKERIYVTGLSMGGFGTWTLAAFSPNRFAALRADLRRRRSEHGPATFPCSSLGFPRSERPDRAAEAFRGDGGGRQEGGRQREVHGLPRGRARLLDGSVQRP